jgi:hypothetical protein
MFALGSIAFPARESSAPLRTFRGLSQKIYELEFYYQYEAYLGVLFFVFLSFCAFVSFSSSCNVVLNRDKDTLMLKFVGIMIVSKRIKDISDSCGEMLYWQ